MEISGLGGLQNVRTTNRRFVPGIRVSEGDCKDKFDRAAKVTINSFAGYSLCGDLGVMNDNA